MDRDLEAPDSPDEGQTGGARFQPHPAYKDLDDGVQASITPQQFAWLPDSERSRFMSSIGEAESHPDA